MDTQSAVNFAAKHDTRLDVIVVTIAEIMFCSHPNIGGFVLTTKSNFDRLINELRKTDGKRKESPLVDLEPGEFRRN